MFESRDEKVAVADEAFRNNVKGLSEDEMTEIGRIFCCDYEAAYPMQHYQGRCKLYVYYGKHCEVPFVSKEVCLTGRCW